MDLSFLPHLNALLNSLAIVLLVIGLVLIKQRRRVAHRNVMISAFAVSTLFLVFYLAHKIWRATEGIPINSTYHGEGLDRVFYLLILLTHVVLAMAVPFFGVGLIWLGLSGRDPLHRRVARIGWPVWMYVSVTGVIVYLMLYPFNPLPVDMMP